MARFFLGALLCIFAVSYINCLGQPERIDLNDEGVLHVVDWTVAQISGAMNSLYHHIFLSMPRATRQTLGVVRYDLVLNLAPSTCMNNAQLKTKNPEDCPLLPDGQVQQCKAIVFDHNQELHLGKFRCNPVQKSLHILGGDTHDYQHHGQPIAEHILSQDGHDSVPQPIKNPFLGQDRHDFVPHLVQKPLLGQDGHDYLSHAVKQPLLGQDRHDYLSHDIRSLIEKLSQVEGKADSTVRHMSILGGDDHDYQIHGGDSCLQYRKDFEEFKLKHKPVYGGMKEEARRFRIFCDNMEYVKELRIHEMGTATYGATQFADLSRDEFRKMYLGFNMNAAEGKQLPSAKIPEGDTPTSFDWRDHGVVTPVKSQGSCGSCWAFSTTGNLEGQNAIVNKKLLSLSEQELVDCDKIDQGCNGGLPIQAYEALEKLGGIELESDYSYDGHDEQCHFNKSKIVVKLTGAVNISQDEGEMATWLAANGPISIGINANAMQFYFGGISHPWKIFCNPNHLDHGVLIVGYGVDGSEPFWIVKNSWGSHWGREGYYYVYRGGGTCGLNKMCTSATVAKDV